jgi:hypothetical protein
MIKRCWLHLKPAPQFNTFFVVMSEWSYSSYRAKLSRNGKLFALVTPDGRSALSPKDACILLNALECQSKLKKLQKAVNKHAREIVLNSLEK